jgi:branched-chain amino acid transport system ATP-binding protein
VLRTDALTVRFGGVSALDGVAFEAAAGQVTGLIGPNGAGKTTMFNVITGFQRPNSGKVFLNGEDITRRGPLYRARMGMGRTFQRLEVFGSLSARDNVMVALEARGRDHLSRRARGNRADQLLARVGLSAEAATPADVLPTGTARLLEMARALACRPTVLLLDEASSGLGSQESTRLGDLMLELANEGMAVILVEHDMDLVMRVCDRIFVLDFGQMIANGTPEDIRCDLRVKAAYLGTQEIGVADGLPVAEEVE